MAARRVTLTEVARIAGVGIATVSRALGDHPDVSEVTRHRIREIAADLGYRPSATARALRSGGFHLISTIIPDAGWGWWQPVVQAAHKAAAAQGYHLLVHPVGSDGSLAATVDGLENIPTEGVIVISVPDQDAVRAACDRLSLPAIAIDDTSRTTRFPTVSAANREGARTVVEHLISEGRRSIALARGVLDRSDPDWGDGLFLEERAEGYFDALAAAGLEVDPRLVVDCADPFDEERERFSGIDALLADGPEIDAIFCSADLMAAPVLRSLRAHGREVPTDVAVAGFDDERAALLLNPQLTSVRQPYERMGEIAVDMLLRMIHGEKLPERSEQLATTLVVRGSTRAGA